MKKYSKIKRVGHDQNQGMFENPEDTLIIKEKLDGCMPYNQRVITSEGATPIGKIVNDQKDVEVLSYNKEKQMYEYKKITDYFKNGSTDNWLDIRHGSKQTKLVTTPNHEIYTAEGKKQAGDLKKGEYILAAEPRLNGDLESLIKGTLIGDGCIQNRDKTKRSHMTVCHGENQHDYAKWKEKQLGDFIVSSSRTYESAYDPHHPETTKYEIKTKSATIFDELAEKFYDKDGRTIPEDLSLDKKAIAVWFMDDGSVSFSDKQRPRATLHTQSYSEESIEILVRELNKNSIEAKSNEYGNGYVIEIGADDTEKLFDVIAPYVPSCMTRKLSDDYCNRDVDWNISVKPFKSEIKSISDTEPRNKMRYDIEVKDNHNYVTKNAIVSNSNFRWTYNKDGKPVFGSKNVEYVKDGEPIYNSGEYEKLDGRFTNAIEYIREYADQDELLANGYDPKRYTFFGENMVRHSLEYEWDDVPQVICFDVYDEKEQEWLSTEESQELFSHLGLPYAPVVEYTTVEEFKEQHGSKDGYTIPESEYRDGKGEGVVIINTDAEENRRSGFNTRAKLVTDEFAEKHKKATGANQSKEAIHGHEKAVSKFCTDGRIRKHIHKMEDQGRELGMELMANRSSSDGLPIRVAKDIVEEEYDSFVTSNWKVDFKEFRSLVADRCVYVLRQEVQKL